MKRSAPMKRSRLKAGKPLARGTTRLKRTAKLKARKVPRAFRQRRDPAYTKWVRAQPCLVAGRDTTRQLSLRDRENVIHSTRDGEVYSTLTGSAYWHHVCWGPIDAAHVGAHRATGAPDRGVVVPLCRAAHHAYDEHRERWEHLVYPQLDLDAHAVRLAAQYEGLWPLSPGYTGYQRETGAP